MRTAVGTPVLGWIGTTRPFISGVDLPVLSELARTQPFRLKVVGAGVDEVVVPGVES